MKILIAADYYPVRRAEKLLRERKYEYLLGEIQGRVTSADYSIVNYESTFFGNNQMISKSGPNMATDEQSVELAQWCGFNCSTLANNHIHDYGDKGLSDLLACMEKRHMDYVGAGMNVHEAEKVLYKSIKGYKVAFINCCEHEFNIADEEHGGANPLNPVTQYYSIKEAKKNADYVIMIIHGGSINCQLPSPRMQEQYRFFVDCGANAVINHHQHCFSGYEYYNNAPIVYGLGNLFFDKPWLKNTTWTDGYMVELNLIDDHFTIELIPYLQCADEPRVILKKDDVKEEFFKAIDELNQIISNPTILKKEYLKWVDKNEEQIRIVFEAVQNPYLSALQRRKLFPEFKSDTIDMLDYIYCEAHLDRMLRYLKKKYKVQ